MLRSLYAGVSGLRNHQTKLDVLGNNIANVNTVGFKSSRVVFSQALTQAFSESKNSSGNGFLNPVQIGLGVQVNSIDRLFNQGAFESTGNMTDMAIEGDGFFILSNGDNSFYSRSGNFSFDQAGNLVNPKGMTVQGWLLDGNETAIGSAGLQDIQIDDSIMSDARATSRIGLSGNIDASLSPRAQEWTLSNALTTKALLTGSSVTAPLTVTAGVNDELSIALSGNGAPVTESLTLSANTYATVDDVVTELNAQITTIAGLAGSVEAVNRGGQITFRSLDGVDSTRIEVGSGTNDVLGDLGFSDGDTATAGSIATETTDINDLINVSTDFITGDRLNISGANMDGSQVSGAFAYGTDGTTLADFVNSLSTTYSSSTASLVDGQIVLTDDAAGDSETIITIISDSTNTGSMNFPGFSSTVDGFTGMASTSVQVFDSLGGGHNLLLEYTKTENPGEWTWEVTAGGDEEILSGGSGRVLFNEFGEMVSFTYDNSDTSLRINPGNSAAVMEIAIEADGEDGFAGLSQFDSASTLYVAEQDGRTTGQLLGLNISREGTVSGAFSNGEIMNLAQIALARFGNNSGLIDLGDGLNEESISSGQAEITGLVDNSGVSIAAGVLEMSNVDLSREFTELIVAQRGFQANAKVITTADTILDELIRLKR
ncbi:MAG: flagellar hook-basal body complex protein [Calditrichia bacterium]